MLTHEKHTCGTRKTGIDIRLHHPYALTIEEAKRIVSMCLGKGNAIIDLFGGSGIVSYLARNKFDEVIYCDHKKFVKVPGVYHIYDDYSEALSVSDRKTVIFADPFYYGVWNYDNEWNYTENHYEFTENLLDIKYSHILILNAVGYRSILERYGIRAEEIKWGKRDDLTNIRIFNIRKK